MNGKSGFHLDFERPILDLEKKLAEMARQAEVDGIDLSQELQRLEQRIEALRQEIYSRLTPWQRVQLSRHPQRPYALDYVSRMLTEFTELHGDRAYGDDLAVIGGPARLEGEPLMVVGMQSGRTIEERQRRNFGMPHPEGYRKALRLMRLAAKFRLPILSLVDTSAAFPGIEAEERGQAEAIARNLMEMSHLPVPVVVAVIGQGGSGGAIGLAVGDRILMLENAWYSVIAPEACSTILFKTRDQREQAADALHLTAADLHGQRIIDRIVPEPFGGAHRDWDEAAAILKRHVSEALAELRGLSAEELVAHRIQKFCAMGTWAE
ncbi:MAG: acetyl-CoA carboxylase carboxyltransferase subunit alpha [Candidatus Latescibacterota bacterium]|jgi:acetyl-CoA carboxylase carboxyl transferase subunit alpha